MTHVLLTGGEGIPLTCPICEDTATVSSHEYTEAVTTHFPGGSHTSPPVLLGWYMTCGDFVAGAQYRLYVTMSEAGFVATAEFLPADTPWQAG